MWAGLKNKNKYSFMDKNAVKLACGIVAAAECSVSFSESDQSGCQERQHPLVILITQVKII